MTATVRERGAILATVVVTATVLFILVGVAYTYFSMAVRATVFTMNRTRALVAAETGVNLAVHYLESLETLPETGDPIVFEMAGDSSGWTALPGGGRAMIVMDPHNRMGGFCDNGAVEVRCMGISGDVTREIRAGVAPAYSSSYALLTSTGIPEGFFVDGRMVNGAVHSNGPIYFSSYSPDSTGDPYADMLSSTSEGGFFIAGAGNTDNPHPDGSSVWVRPYWKHRQGNPYWQPVTPAVDFNRMTQYFRNLVHSTTSAGTVHISAARIIIEGNRLRYRESESSEDRLLELNGINLVVIDNGFGPVMIKSSQRTEHPITFLTRNNLIIGGGIDGSAAGSGGPMGLVALGDIVIAADPDETGGSDWTGRWQIETSESFVIRASLAAPSGSFRAEVPYSPEEIARVSVTGSLTENSMGRLSSVNSGYELGVTWEQGLGALHPPFFPLLGRWNIYSWLIDPPLQGDSKIEDDRL